jgi:hypothetical protein
MHQAVLMQVTQCPEQRLNDALKRLDLSQLPTGAQPLKQVAPLGVLQYQADNLSVLERCVQLDNVLVIQARMNSNLTLDLAPVHTRCEASRQSDDCRNPPLRTKHDQCSVLIESEGLLFKQPGFSQLQTKLEF